MRIEHDEGAEARQIRVLRSMTPEQRLLQAFELSERMRRLFEEGLRRRFPGLSEGRFRSLLRARLDACHNGNY